MLKRWGKRLGFFALWCGVMGLAAIGGGRIALEIIFSGRSVHTPQCQGMTVEEANKACQRLGLQVVVAEKRFDALGDRGMVLEQEPSPGKVIKGGRLVRLVVSLGREPLTVPDLTGLSLQVARTRIGEEGLVVGSLGRIPIRRPQDEVINQSPPAQSTLFKGGAVDLLLSDGPPDALWLMPRVVGRDLSSVKRLFFLHGLPVGRVTEQIVPGIPPGRVVQQSPIPGAPINETRLVLLGVSR